MEKKFLVHAKQDSVGVAVADIDSGEEVEGTLMDSGGKVSLRSQDAVPLGHKIALAAIKKGEKVVEYGEPIGVATENIQKGAHVHVHNISSLRWGKASR
ncbi:MAG: UxaA family hydrolase [Nitrososphaerota archaeon]|nr:UxaA family hydrolase [Nitrososphaerota archaeon]